MEPSDFTNYRVLSGQESFGTRFLGIKVLVKMDREFTDADSSAAYKLVRSLEKSLDLETAKLDPKTQEDADSMTADIKKCFVDAGFSVIYMERVPNEYFGELDPAFALSRPWYVVTTPIGHIKIGWRKRVLVVDWFKTSIGTSAEALFPNEDVTKDDNLIHAWSYAKATEYLMVLKNAAETGGAKT